jgi:hypothetical protein
VRSSSANFFFLTLPHTKKENRMQKSREKQQMQNNSSHSDFKNTEGKPETKTKEKNKIERKTGNYLPYLRYHPQMFSPSAHWPHTEYLHNHQSV